MLRLLEVLRVVVDDLTVRLVEAGSQVLLSKCQPNSIGDTLTKRSCRTTILETETFSFAYSTAGQFTTSVRPIEKKTDQW
jgi:hypothetical protein